MMKGKIAYLAGPVRAIGRHGAVSIRREIELYFLNRGMTTFNPPGAWDGDGGERSEEFIRSVNRMVVTVSRIMAVTHMLDKHGNTVQSPGTEEEVAIAANLGISIMVFVADKNSMSKAIAWLTQMLSVRERAVRVEFGWLKQGEYRGVTSMTLEAVKYDPRPQETDSEIRQPTARFE